jgi:hypothetical protein
MFVTVRLLRNGGQAKWPDYFLSPNNSSSFMVDKINQQDRMMSLDPELSSRYIPSSLFYCLTINRLKNYFEAK